MGRDARRKQEIEQEKRNWRILLWAGLLVTGAAIGSALSGCGVQPAALDEVVCDRGSYCDIFGCRSDEGEHCDRFEGEPVVHGPDESVDGIVSPNLMPPFGAGEDGAVKDVKWQPPYIPPDPLLADDAPSTRLKVCSGPLPSLSLRDNAEGGCHDYTVSYPHGVHDDPGFLPDYLNNRDDDTFRHVYFEGGSPACVFTGKRLTRTAGRISNVDGGRDCNAGGPQQCAYIAQGYQIYAVTGKSCSEAGVPICGGLFCR